MTDTEISYMIMNTRTGTTYRILGTGPTENAPHMTAVWVQKVGTQGAAPWSADSMMSDWHDLVAVDTEGHRQAQPAPVEYRVLDTATGRTFIVLGTTVDGTSTTNIWLRALDTQQVEHMWTSTFAVMRDFVAVCNHGYTQWDSCPGCDHDEEMAQAAPVETPSPEFVAADLAFRKLKQLEDSYAMVRNLSNRVLTGPELRADANHRIESTERTLGRALYLIRDLIEHVPGANDTVTRARAFLAEVDAQ